MSSPPPPSSVEVVQTVPSRITMHTIEDHQLTALTNVSRPLTLAVAGAAFGAFAGLLPMFVDALGQVGTAKFTGGDMFYAVADVLCGVATLHFGFRAYAGEREAAQMVTAIRARQERPF